MNRRRESKRLVYFNHSMAETGFWETANAGSVFASIRRAAILHPHHHLYLGVTIAVAALSLRGRGGRRKGRKQVEVGATVTPTGKQKSHYACCRQILRIAAMAPNYLRERAKAFHDVIDESVGHESCRHAQNRNDHCNRLR